MKAVRFADFGGPEVLETVEVTDPVAGTGEVVVQVVAAAVNRLDLDERDGTSGFGINPEHQLGREGAGIVSAVGAGVDRAWLGRRVAVSAYRGCWECESCQAGNLNVCARQTRPGIDVPGTYAEYVTAPLGGLFVLPDGIDLEDAACLQLGLGTAWHGLLRRGGLRAGQRVLITGAGGGVGTAAVQVAVLAGAEVIATASTPGRRELATSLGASATLAADFTTDELRDLTGGDGVDLVFDAGGGPFMDRGLAALTTGGRYVLYGSHSEPTAEIDVIAFFRSYGELVATRGWRMEDMRDVIDAVAAGRLDPLVRHRWTFADAPVAHRALADRQVDGKAVLVP